MNTNEPRPGRPEDEAALARLVRLAGRRPAPPPDAWEASRAAAEAAWKATVNRRRRRRRMLSAAVAAVAASVLLVILAPFGARPGAPPVATVALVEGAVEARAGDGEPWAPLAVESGGLAAGTRVRTGPGGVALGLAGGGSLRLDAATEMVLESADRLRLLAGGAYLDTGAGARSQVEIRTPAGTVRHVGTQFEVRHGAGGLRLRVREGRVLLDYAGGEVAARAGEEVTLAQDGSVAAGTVEPFGEHWAWVQALAPMPGGDERTLASFLDWVSRETGRRVHFSRPGLEVRARTTILHGAARRMTPMEALAVMLETTDFRYTVTGGGEILIEERRF